MVKMPFLSALGVLLLLALLCALHHAVAIQGLLDVGSCWQLSKSDGSCGRLLRTRISKDECCLQWENHRRAFSVHSSVDGGTPTTHGLSNTSSTTMLAASMTRRHACIPCTPSCASVRCGDDRKCALRGGVPRCICAPKCHLKQKEPVCGSDSRTYTTECHLLKRACRKKQRLMVAHFGPCQTCSGMRCALGRKCVLDEQLIPHCQRCPDSCTAPSKLRPICGVDGKTYPSPCHMKRASCRTGREVVKAYKGECKAEATCSNVRCWRDHRCLTQESTGAPQCTWCGALESCVSSGRAVCASDKRAYPSWCAFRHEACRSGRALTQMSQDYCIEVDQTSDVNCDNKKKKTGNKVLSKDQHVIGPELLQKVAAAAASAAAAAQQQEHKKHLGTSTPTPSSKNSKKTKKKKKKKKDCRKNKTKETKNKKIKTRKPQNLNV